MHIRLAYSTLACPDWDIKKIVKSAKEFGYAGVELRGQGRKHVSPELTNKERSEIRSMFEDNGVDIACVSAYTRFTMADKAERQANVDDLKRMIELASDLGCGTIRTFGGDIPQGDSRNTCARRLADALSSIDHFAYDHQVDVVLETHDAFSRGLDVKRVLNIAQCMNVNALWDIHHTIAQDEAPRETVDNLRGYISYIHAKDWVSPPFRDQDHYVLMGSGKAPMQEVLCLLDEIDYDGYISLEWEKMWHPDIEDSEVAIYQFSWYMRQLMAWRRLLMEVMAIPDEE